MGRRVSEQRQSRKDQVAETLLKAKDRLVSATSEVTLLLFLFHPPIKCLSEVPQLQPPQGGATGPESPE